ncbi:hypothetical protein ACFL3V_02935 [Nanoarchaeota archaeon]
MKKTILFFTVFLVSISFVFAAGQKADAPTPTMYAADKAGQGSGAQAEPVAVQVGQGSGEGVQENAEVTTQAQVQNKGDVTQVQAQTRTQTQTKAKAGDYVSENGNALSIKDQSNNRMQLKVGNAAAETSMEMTQEQVQEKTRLKVKLSNGKNAEIKVMPDTASEKARERLRLRVCSAENGCSIELKEVSSGNEVRAAYEVQAQKESKLLGLFKKKMQVQAQVDAENGEIIRTKKPWWAFLASEPEA